MRNSFKDIIRLLSLFLVASMGVGFAGCAPAEDLPTEKLPEGNYLIDLHLHIDGAMSVDTALSLAKMQGTTLPTYDRAKLESLLRVPDDCRDLNEYLEKFALPCSLMMTKETISEMVYRLEEELRAAGIIYAELRFAPQLHTAQGLTQEEVVRAAIEGSKRSSLKSNLILCCMRGDDNNDANMETVRLAAKYRNSGICAIDLAGAEALYPTENFSSLFAYARSLGLKYTIHAGEAADHTSVLTAFKFNASRIGHGVHSAYDQATMKQLSDKKIPLELCITSNLQTKAEQSLETYPIKTLMDNGVIVTLNTDNPMVSGTSMKKELEIAKTAFDLSNDDIKGILLNSAEYSFADKATKAYLRSEIEKAFLQDK